MNIFLAIWHKFFPVNVSAIVSDLEKTVTKLENAANYHNNKVQVKAASAAILLDAVTAHQNEAAKAKTVAANINTLINPPVTQ